MFECEKTCFECIHSSIDPGYPGSFDPRYGGDPPVAAEAFCQHTLAYKSQTEDMTVGDGEAKDCPHFHEKIVKCAVCDEYVLISEIAESSYGAPCCSENCYKTQMKKENRFESIGVI